uniref:Gsp_17 putative toxin n=1 Tax=Gemmula speciosa TaxID=439592 RepID=A0A098LWC6_GEMSP
MALSLDILMSVTMVTAVLTTVNAEYKDSRLDSRQLPANFPMCQHRQLCAVASRATNNLRVYCRCSDDTICPISDDHHAIYPNAAYICQHVNSYLDPCVDITKPAIVTTSEIYVINCRCDTYQWPPVGGKVYCESLPSRMFKLF